MSVSEEIESLAKRRGFFWPAAQIYEPVSGFWNYGPLGTLMRNKLLDMWRDWFVRKEGAYEISTVNILPEAVWKASGHLDGFNDKQCICEGKEKHRWRADHLLEEANVSREKLEGKSVDELTKMIKKNNIKCPKCKSKLGKVFVFNLMFDMKVGPTGELKAYLKPETTQSSVLDFPYIYRTMRAKLPLKIAQIGKSFRNEISPRQMFIRLREFWMAELQIFFNPDSKDFDGFDVLNKFKIRILPHGQKTEQEVSVADAVKKDWIPNVLIGYYLAKVFQFYEALGFERKVLRFRELSPDERAHYSKVHWDFEIHTKDFGWTEAVNNSWRTDYDLKRHQKFSKQSLEVFENDKKILPHMYEPSFGIDRTLMLLMIHAYKKEGKRSWLELPPQIAPYQVAVFPLVKKDGLDKRAEEIAGELRERFDVFYDSSDSIGRRYARVDEIGVPYAVTIDYDTLKDKTVTVRYRDTTKQERVKISELDKKLKV